MARLARERSESGVYHILLRKRDISVLQDNEDADAFLQALMSERERDFIDVYAYCLFEGYIHLVVKEGICGISNNIMRVCSAYATYYNKKYACQGKLFRDRFYSKPLEETADILDCTRFVHRLPLEFSQDLEYDFSSYKQYFKKSDLLSSSDIIPLAGSQIDYRVYCDAECSGVYKDIKRASNKD